MIMQVYVEEYVRRSFKTKETNQQSGTTSSVMRGFFSIIGSYETKSMAVQQEIKSQLAKLLATEDIVVEHKKIETAQFNVDTRVLILPLWEKASNYVYDMLVGHEVGHALFTPNVDPPKDVPHQFLNVVEDARIEKLM